VGQIIENFKNIWAEADRRLSPKDFVRQIRKDLETISWPSRDHEDFKYTSLSKHLAKNFTPSKNETFKIEEDGHFQTITFINGHLSAHQLDSTNLKLSEVNPDSSFLKKPSKQIFSLLNWAGGNQTIHLEVTGPCPKPILITYIQVDGDPLSLSGPRISVSLTPGAQATILEESMDLGGGSGFVNKLFMASLGEGSELTHYRIQNDGKKTTSNCSNEIEVQKDATYRTWNFNIGGLLGREVCQVRFMGEQASAHLKGLYLSNENRQLDQHIEVYHDFKNTFSTQHFKGILRDQSKAVFNGRIFVGKGASGVDAKQLNNNLLLSSEAEVDTKPELIIENSDVKCSHGATVGHLNPDQIFYLRARGIPEASAEEMICRAFAEEIILDIEDSIIRKRVARACASALNQGGPHASV